MGGQEMTHKQFIQAFCIRHYEMDLGNDGVGKKLGLIDHAEIMWNEIEEYFVKKEREKELKKEQERREQMKDYITF